MAVPTSTEKGQNVDMLALPPAGVSLTQDNSKFPWGNPPKEADPNVALTTMLDKLEEPASRENLLKLLMAGVSIESLISMSSASWVVAMSMIESCDADALKINNPFFSKL